MQTFDQSLMQLYRKKLITLEEALRQCSNPDDFKLKVSGITSTTDAEKWDYFDKSEEESEKKPTGSSGGDDFEIERF